MSISPENYEYLIRLSVALVCGLVIGTERGIRHKAASFRTFMIVSVASCLYAIMSLLSSGDPHRIAAQIVSGIGFLGGGIIFKTKDKAEGITTASMIWFASAQGMCCGFGYIQLAIITQLLYIGILVIGKILHIITDGPK